MLSNTPGPGARADIAREFPRRFVPNGADLGNWEEIAPLFERLEQTTFKDAAQVESWLLDWSELAACLSEKKARRYISMSRNTEDAAAESAYRTFSEEIDPKVHECSERLNRKLLEAAKDFALSGERYGVLLRNMQADVRLFRLENLPILTQLESLSTDYQKLAGAMTVTLNGVETTLPQLGTHFENPDRAVRRQAWTLEMERRFKDSDALDQLYSEMIQRRDALAKNAGLPSFVDYAFLTLYRFDYSPADCQRFHEAVERCVVPVTRELNSERQQAMRLEGFRPWDSWWPWYYALDPLGRPALKPYLGADQLVPTALKILDKVDGELAVQLREMQRRGDLDLESRKGKAPGAYSYCLDEIRRPFIFQNAAGLHKDLETLLHEGGHSFHSLAARSEPLQAYRSAPIEFCEVASMSMELFGSCHLEEIYSPQDAIRARSRMYEGILEFLRWAAQIDAFQHWAYTNPGHTPAERRAHWVELDRRFAPNFDWAGVEHYREMYWQRQHHLFVNPMYYIEYAIAQLGALQLWQNFRKDPAAAVASYKRALALGGSRPVPELFNAAGAKFDFSAATLEPLVDELRAAIVFSA